MTSGERLRATYDFQSVDHGPGRVLYMAGGDSIPPFEVAGGCDVVAIAKQYPELIMTRGGYFPTCDHGVPDDVSYENYMYYRQRVCELDHR